VSSDEDGFPDFGFFQEPMIMLTAEEVETGTAGTLANGSKSAVFNKISIDTRTLQTGDIFFAIRGPNLDGHRYIPDALAKGALGAVAERSYQYPEEFPGNRVLIKVEDTHKALKDLAAWTRRRWTGTLVAITGSMGKTTTREFVTQVLRSQFNVYQTPGNYNNLFGLPLALLGLAPEHHMGIFEMGMSTPGEIAEMCRIAVPDIGILTNVAPVHLQFFGSLGDIARAKEELAQALLPDGELIYNIDDPLVSEIAERFAGRKVSFGFSERADIRADRIKIISLSETRFRLSFSKTSWEAAIPLPGSHFVMNALPAVALGLQHNIPPDKIVESLAHLQQAAMRGQILQFKEGFSVIDDSYNSNPLALMNMIELLSRMPSFARRILVAGEMLELGKDTDSLHAECGTYAANSGLDMVIGIQGAARQIVEAAVKAGLPESRTRFFPNSAGATDFINGELRAGDLVLVKGSRGVRAERIIQSLRSHFELIR
jgi:UDP-N-acetylmuramoyl-tripeptide--D-alanyl-D-alanine ligase